MGQVVVRIEGHIYKQFSKWDPQGKWLWCDWDRRGEETIRVQPHTIEAIVETEDEEFVAERVEALRAKKHQIYVDAETEIAEVNEKLEKLLALTHST